MNAIKSKDGLEPSPPVICDISFAKPVGSATNID